VYLQATDWKSGTGGDPLAGTPRFFALGQNSPNPCGGITSISFSLPVASRVKLSVYNITGQLVKTLVDGQAGAGHHSTAWNGRDQGGQAAATGIYFYRMEAAGADGRRFAQTKRLNLVK
jgi:flagellar hook assembly protein FlgD